MSQATNVLDRIIAQEDFDSEYTNKSTSEYSIMGVKAEKLFDDLSDEEKFRYSDFDQNGYNLLNIWNVTWVYIPLFQDWFMIVDDCYKPEFLCYTQDNIEYTIDTNTFKVYSKIHNYENIRTVTM